MWYGKILNCATNTGMKRLIVITLILIAAIAYVTVKYFTNLSTSAAHAGNVIRTIPDDAALVFEFTNENSFYDIYKGNTILGNLIGRDQLSELEVVKKVLIDNSLLNKAFNGHNAFISVHPGANNDLPLLLTISAKNIDAESIDDISKQHPAGMLINPLKLGERKGYTIYFNQLKKRLFVFHNGGNVFTASFSKELVERAASYTAPKEQHHFMLLPDQQNSNSLINLYVNYEHLQPIFDRLFIANTEIFKPFRLLAASSALNLNYKNDAIMFSGYTMLQTNKPGSYLSIFTQQQPVENHLRDLYPVTTAYATGLAVSDIPRYFENLSTFQQKAGLQAEKDALLSKIKTETGIKIEPEFEKLSGNEFAVITTRFNERFALIAVKNGSELRPFMTNISTMVNDDIGQFNYAKIPYFLLGDVFSIFKKPYFRIIDNYLILANSVNELQSFSESYFKRSFLSKTDKYLPFNKLLAERSNINFLLHFKNAQQILKQSLKPQFFIAFKNSDLSFSNFYGASLQFSASDKNYYTNFFLLQNPPDSTATVKTE